jgi:hypothetical protein
VATVLSWLAALAVAVAVWSPHLAHYYVGSPTVTPAMLEEARRVPDDALLRELAGFAPGYGVVQPVFAMPDPVPAATRLLAGDVDMPGLPRLRVTLPFSPTDLDKDDDEGQLTLAAFTLPQLLLRAYAKTQDDRYLFAARDMIVGWADYERRAWLPRGFLWNDHAVAARIPVLAAFWLAYRHHPAYDPAVGRKLLAFVARSGALLARPAHFTVTTNHGVMQNLALWHLALAFPELPEAQGYRRLALDRLDDQMGFYVDEEGVVLEHSAGYHRAGVELLGMALRYLTLLGEAPPETWVEKYGRALEFYGRLRRPDGSLPGIGDTTGDPTDDSSPAGPLTTRVLPDRRSEPLAYRESWPLADPDGLYPVAGYAIWWSGLGVRPEARHPRQTAVTWSYFPGHGHKHADEMSVLLWGAGRTWITSVGYWPYGVPGRARSESWSGSNAPHLVGEPALSARSTRLVGSGWSERLAALDLERRLAGGYVARRQVVHAEPDLWIVADHASGAADATARVQWTAAADLTLRSLVPGSAYRVESNGGDASMSLRLASSPGTVVRELRGSHDPFAGWQVVRGRPLPAGTVLVDQPARDAWAIAVWCLQEKGVANRCSDRPIAARFAGDEDWSVDVPGERTSVVVARSAQGVRVSAGAAAPATTALHAAIDVGPARARIRAAYEKAAAKYPRFRDLGYYRLRATYALFAVFGLQEVFFAALCPSRYHRRLRVAAIVGWLAGGLWLVSVYFA